MLPDLNDPRYLSEVGWFLYHEKFRRQSFGGTYNDERLAHSSMLLEEVVGYLGVNKNWIENKVVVTVGSGCTCQLAAWPAAAKVAVDPLLYVYQKLDMLMDDAPGTSPTINLSVTIEDHPLLDESVDLVLCRNVLDHIPEPSAALRQISRMLKREGRLFVSVDIGGCPTPDEPTVFSEESLLEVLAEDFEVLSYAENPRPHSRQRLHSLRVVARKPTRRQGSLDKEEVLRDYMTAISNKDDVEDNDLGIDRPGPV